MRTAKLVPVLICLGLSAIGADAAEFEARIRDQKGEPLEDAVVTLRPLDVGRSALSRTSKEVVDQVDKEFIPYVKPIMVGSLVHFPNKDNIRHHVYSFSPAKRFELPLYSGSSAPPVLFDKPGVVVLGCNIHDWMIGYLYVSDTPYFSKSDKNGSAAISDLPPGQYTARVWHPRLDGAEEATSRRLVIEGGTATAEWRLGLKSEYRIPRGPGAKSAGYR